MARCVALVLLASSVFSPAVAESSFSDTVLLIQSNLNPIELAKEGVDSVVSAFKKPDPSRVKPVNFQHKLNKTERESVEAQARLSEMGAPMTLIVKDPMGREAVVSFRKQARLAILFETVCQQWDCSAENSVFRFNKKWLSPYLTPELVGLTDMDIIDADGADIQHNILKRAEKEKRLEVYSKMQKAVDTSSEEEKSEMKKMRRKVQGVKEHAELVAAEEQRRDLKYNNMVPLTFKSPAHGIKDITIPVKRDLPLQSVMDMVAKTMHLDRTQIRFFIGNRLVHRREIKLNDTPDKLKITDRSRVEVLAPKTALLKTA